MTSLPANIRVNAAFPFPALTQGLGPVTVLRQNGVWSIGFSTNISLSWTALQIFNAGITTSFVGTNTISTLSPFTLTGTTGTVTASQSSIIFNPSGGFTVTLPDPTLVPGQWLDLKLIANQTVASATANVVPITGGAAGTAIFPATSGKWARLQSNGVNWSIMAAN